MDTQEEMNFAMNLWAEYLRGHFPVGDEAPPPIDKLRPEAVLKLIWPLLDVIRERAIALKETAVSEAFDGEADAALISLAKTGNFDEWERISVGAWAVLIDRFQWSIAALTLEGHAESAFTIPIPREASQDVRAKAALLFVLAGPGRSPPPQWRKTQSEAAHSKFQHLPLRRQ